MRVLGRSALDDSPDLVSPVYEYSYDAYGNQLSIRDPLHVDTGDAATSEFRETQFEYDHRGRQLQRQLPLGVAAANDDIPGNDNTFVEKMVYGTTPISQLAADIHRSVAFGQLESMTDFEGRKTQYFYDNSPTGGGRMVEKQYFDKNDTLRRTITYKHDAVGRQTVIGDDGAVKNGTDGGIVNHFDADGRLEAVTSPQGTIEYDYDDRGRMTSTTIVHVDRTNTEAIYSYDSSGRLVKVDAETDTTYRYDAVGNLAVVTTAIGDDSVVSTYTYDPLNRLDLLTVNHVSETGDTTTVVPFAVFDYTVRADGKRSSVEETFYDSFTDGETITTHWIYDAIGRLVGELREEDPDFQSYSITRYTYDLVGNRREKLMDDSVTIETATAFKENGLPFLDLFTGDLQTTYFYDKNDRLTQEETTGNQNRTVDYEYGENADATQLTKKSFGDNEDTTYLYDEMGRQSKITTGNSETEYKYDAMGNRVSQSIGNTTTQFLIDTNNHTGYAQILEEIRESDNRSYTIGLDVIHQQDGTNSPKILVADGHGSTRLMLTASDELFVSQRYDYDAYGNLLNDNLVNADTSLLYSGEFTDLSGQQYLRARFYDSSTGRFNRLDDFAGNANDPQSLHKYAYGHNDPVSNIDPSGMFSAIGVGSASSIGASLQGQQGGVAQATLEAVHNGAANGLSVNQALQQFAASLLFDQFGFAAIGAAIGYASRALVFAGQNVVGFARVSGGIALPGTLISRTRLIPGTPGVIRGGSSTNLKRAILRKSGILTDIPARGFQAHHIIPTAIANKKPAALTKIGFDLDDATNGILLPTSLHSGRHPDYSIALGEALDRIPGSLSVQKTMERVYEVQAKAARAFVEKGASLTGADRTTLNQWRNFLS